jgi:predicted alpha/beta-fold hydrolase
MDSDLPPFKERFPWCGGDLQTLATALLPHQIPACSEQREFPVDGDNTLVAALDSPVMASQVDKPLALLIHGVPGSQESPYLHRMSEYLLGLGHKVLRLNLRGAGPSRSKCAGQYYAGSSEDIRQLLAQLPTDLTHNGIVAVGYSIGGAVLLKYLGEEGTRAPIVAAASVSAPIELLDTCLALMRPRNMPYHSYVLTRTKRNALGGTLTREEKIRIKSAVTLLEFDDLFTAPRNGFSGADEYYAKCSALNFLPGIRVPTLVLTSLDDPWVPGSAYSGYYWRSNEYLMPLLLACGGHVGFHDSASNQPWSDRAIGAFFERQTT